MWSEEERVETSNEGYIGGKKAKGKMPFNLYLLQLVNLIFIYIHIYRLNRLSQAILLFLSFFLYIL